MNLNCSSCKISKSVSEFHRNKASKTGYHNYCKECRKPLELERKRQHYRDNKEVYSKRHTEWQRTNKDSYNAYMRMWNKENKIYNNAENRENRANYRAKMLEATPKWGDPKKIKAIYKLAKNLQDELGIKLHVDHIEPLQGNISSGLHIWWNLQILPEKVNLSKCNKILENIISPRVSDNFNDYLIEVENLCRAYTKKSVRIEE